MIDEEGFAFNGGWREVLCTYVGIQYETKLQLKVISLLAFWPRDIAACTSSYDYVAALYSTCITVLPLYLQLDCCCRVLLDKEG